MNKAKYILPFFLLFALFAYARKRKSKNNFMPLFKKITDNPTIRDCDPKGCGYFGASRTGHIHHGVDVIAYAGQSIFAPIMGQVRRLYVYEGSTKMKGIEISNATYSVKLFYLQTDLKTGDFVTAGDLVGVAQNIAGYYNAENVMTNHVHVEVRKHGKLIDPTALILREI